MKSILAILVSVISVFDVIHRGHCKELRHPKGGNTKSGKDRFAFCDGVAPICTLEGMDSCGITIYGEKRTLGGSRCFLTHFNSCKRRRYGLPEYRLLNPGVCKEKCKVMQSRQCNDGEAFCAVAEDGATSSFWSNCQLGQRNCQRRDDGFPEFKAQRGQVGFCKKERYEHQVKCEDYRCSLGGEPVCAADLRGRRRLFRNKCEMEKRNCYDRKNTGRKFDLDGPEKYNFLAYASSCTNLPTIPDFYKYPAL